MRAFRIGHLKVGIRVNTPELDSALVACLRDVSVDDPDVPPNYAIRREDQVDPSGQPRYRVYIGCKQAATTRTLERALAIVSGFLEDHLPRTLPEGQLDLVAVAFVGATEAVLAPWQLRHGAPTIETRVERYGIKLLEQRSVTLDVVSKEVVVAPPRLPPPPHQSGIDLAAGGWRVPPGRYRVKAWLLQKGWRWEQITPGIATAYGLSITHRGDDPGRSLSAVATFVTGLPLCEVGSHKDVTLRVRDLLARGPGHDNSSGTST